jgi:HD-GYP domain-containing protein (c-di-GMP phosphodiesterase class II)
MHIDNIREGMVLGRSIYGPNTELFLRRGMAMKDAYITSLRRFNYNYVYIEDKLSEGIEVVDPVTPEQRNLAVRAIKNVFRQLVVGDNVKMQFTGLLEAVTGIIDQVLSNNGTIDNLIALKAHDDYTFHHSVNVCVVSVFLGKKLHINRYSLKNLGIAAILHDIGKVSVPYEIINKPSSLTIEEYDIVKQHPRLGSGLVMDSKIFAPEVARAIYQHHERFDGLGYPDGKGGEDLHQFARIMALADVYDAITSKRPYSNAMTTFEAYECIMFNRGTQFDSEVTNIFLENFAPFPIGTVVQLSNGEIGIVTANNESLMMRPCVRLAGTNEILDLSGSGEVLSITITGIIE